MKNIKCISAHTSVVKTSSVVASLGARGKVSSSLLPSSISASIGLISDCSISIPSSICATFCDTELTAILRWCGTNELRVNAIDEYRRVS